MREARKKAHCAYPQCKQPEILNGRYYIVCQWYMRTPDGRRWRKQKYFHINCWLRQAIEELKQRKVPETRGRQVLALPDDDREMRLSIMRKRAALIQRIRQAEHDKHYGKIDKLVDKMLKCNEEIEPYGGIPKKWKRTSVNSSIVVPSAEEQTGSVSSWAKSRRRTTGLGKNGTLPTMPDKVSL